MSNSEFENNTPDNPAAPVLGMGNTQQIKQEQQKNTKILAGIFVLLLVLVFGVIFVLPRYISPADPQRNIIEVSTPTKLPVGISPFQEAQLLKQRSDAQAVLESLLALQATLEEKQAELWSPELFSSAITLAQQGDELYSQQEFTQAQDFYQQALDTLQNIEVNMPDSFTTFIEAGNQAILANQAAEAEQAFSFAILINPDSVAAVTGYNRAQTLSKVLDLLEQGTELHVAGDFASARDLYLQAQAIDAIHDGVNAAVKKVDADIIERNFLSAMSQGYNAIQNDSPEQAKVAFNQALLIKPGSEQAKLALEQAADQVSASIINQHLAQAQTFENNEAWQLALTEYNQALLIAPTLVAALDGQKRSNSRNNLDLFLTNLIQSPLRLADTAVYQQALRVHQDASQIPDPGPKLLEQLQQTNIFLKRITQAVPVSFLSDGQTKVNVYQISNLGLFTTQTLSLTPGSYVAVGVRNGYRDVRIEFVIPLDGKVPTITVQCEEKIR